MFFLIRFLSKQQLVLPAGEEEGWARGPMWLDGVTLAMPPQGRFSIFISLLKTAQETQVREITPALNRRLLARLLQKQQHILFYFNQHWATTNIFFIKNILIPKRISALSIRGRHFPRAVSGHFLYEDKCLKSIYKCRNVHNSNCTSRNMWCIQIVTSWLTLLTFEMVCTPDSQMMRSRLEKSWDTSGVYQIQQI